MVVVPPPAAPLPGLPLPPACDDTPDAGDAGDAVLPALSSAGSFWRTELSAMPSFSLALGK
ncbi:hypothetical protein D1872_307220 [compost metagenome]